MKRAVHAFVLLLLLTPATGISQDVAYEPPAPSAQSVEEEIRGIKSRIDKEQREIREARKKQQVIEAELLETEEKRTKVTNQQAAIRAQVTRIDEDIERAKSALAESEMKLQKLRIVFRERLVSNYKMLNEAAGVSYLVTATSATDLLRRTSYLSRISQQDEANLRLLQEQMRIVEEHRTGLEKLRRDRKEQLTELAALESGFRQAEERKRGLILKQQNEVKESERAIRSLQQTIRNLEMLLETLTGGEEEIPQPPPVGVPEVQPTRPPFTTREQPAPFMGRGLEPLRGALLFPASGRLLQTYGKQRHEEFSEVLFRKGIEMEVAPSEGIRSIAPGRVVVEQELPGIGLTVIVDHGERYYSLYGRLRESLKHKGEEVGRGDVIGKPATNDAQGRSFYFELRYRGKAVDPGPFFKNLPG